MAGSGRLPTCLAAHHSAMKDTQTVNVFCGADTALMEKLDAIQVSLDGLTVLMRKVLKTEEQEMADLTQLTVDVTSNGDAVDSAVALLSGLAQQIRDLSTDPAALQQLASDLESQTNSLAAAVVANTPAAPDAGIPEPPQ